MSEKKKEAVDGPVEVEGVVAEGAPATAPEVEGVAPEVEAAPEAEPEAATEEEAEAGAEPAPAEEVEAEPVVEAEVEAEAAPEPEAEAAPEPEGAPEAAVAPEPEAEAAPEPEDAPEVVAHSVRNPDDGLTENEREFDRIMEQEYSSARVVEKDPVALDTQPRSDFWKKFSAACTVISIVLLVAVTMVEQLRFRESMEAQDQSELEDRILEAQTMLSRQADEAEVFQWDLEILSNIARLENMLARYSKMKGADARLIWAGEIALGRGLLKVGEREAALQTFQSALMRVQSFGEAHTSSVVLTFRYTGRSGYVTGKEAEGRKAYRLAFEAAARSRLAEPAKTRVQATTCRLWCENEVQWAKEPVAPDVCQEIHKCVIQ